MDWPSASGQERARVQAFAENAVENRMSTTDNPDGGEACMHRLRFQSTSATQTHKNIDRDLNKKNGFRHPEIDASRQVRLVALDGQHRSPADQNSGYLECSTVPIERGKLQQTKYRALSYTWEPAESQSHVKLIMLNGQEFYVRNNVHAFLKGEWAGSNDENSDGQAFQNDDDVLGDLYFIDAICIDQLDREEKAKQVAFMSEIYEHATSVIVYVEKIYGSTREYDQELQWKFAVFRSKLHDLACCYTYGGDFNREESYDDYGHMASIIPWDRDDLLSYGLLCGGRYWTRLWIVQEILLARRATLIAGVHTFDLHRFTAFPFGLIEREYRERYPHMPQNHVARNRTDEFAEVQAEIHKVFVAAGGESGLNVLRKKAERHTMGNDYFRGDLFVNVENTKRTFRNALLNYSGQQCYNPRDRLYGTLGILPEHIRLQISVSYTKGVDSAFEQALRIGLSEIHRDVDWAYCMEHNQNATNRYAEFVLFLAKTFAGELTWQAVLSAKRRVLWELDLRRKWLRYRDLFEDLKNSTADIDEAFDIMERGAFDMELSIFCGACRNRF